MTLPAIQQELDKIADLFGMADRIQKSAELPLSLAMAAAGHLTQYICVRVAGLIEHAVREIFFAYALSRTGASPLAVFVSKSLERPGNLGPEPLCQLVGRFDSAWEVGLRTYMQGERWAAVDSVIKNRNKISHGESVSLGFAQMSDWYRRVVEVLDYIEGRAVP
jgi:hypothetical protein